MKKRQSNLSLQRQVLNRFCPVLLRLLIAGLLVSRTAANPQNPISVRGKQAPSAWATEQQSDRPGPSVPRSLGESCVFGCNHSLPCDMICQSAFAYCKHGGSSSQRCLTDQGVYDNSINFGWTNHINCTGGRLKCDLWIGSVGCNTTSSTSHNVGIVVIDTDSGSVDFGLSDGSYAIAAVHVYVGNATIPLINGTSYISPNHYNSMSWYSPRVSRASIYVEPRCQAGVHVIAHAYICPADSSAPSPAPSVAASPSISQQIPTCPIRAGNDLPVLPDVSPFATPNTPVGTPHKSQGNNSRLLQWDAVLCPFRCNDALLSCDSRCLSAFAYCTDFAPTCVSNVTAAMLLGRDAGTLESGWSNPVTCHGGNFECELRIGSSDCNSNYSESSLVGSVVLDTDANIVKYIVSVPNLAMSSLQIFQGDSPQSITRRTSIQRTWFRPNTYQASVYLQSAARPGSVLVAHANLCPVDNPPSVPRSLYVVFDPSSVTNSDATCPIQAKSIPPTVSPATPSSMTPTVASTSDPTPSATQEIATTDDDTPVDDNGTDEDDGDVDGGTDDRVPVGSTLTTRPSTCRPSRRTSDPTFRPMELIQLPPHFFRRRAFPDFCIQPQAMSSKSGSPPSRPPKTRRPTSSSPIRPTASPAPSASSRPSSLPSASPKPTASPKPSNSAYPSPMPSIRQSRSPAVSRPTASPAPSATSRPSTVPSASPKPSRSSYPSPRPSIRQSLSPDTTAHSHFPLFNASEHPSQGPVQLSMGLTDIPTSQPSTDPSTNPAGQAAERPRTAMPTRPTTSLSPSTPQPTEDDAWSDPTDTPSGEADQHSDPTFTPSRNAVTTRPTQIPSLESLVKAKPTIEPTVDPTEAPIGEPTEDPTTEPTKEPTSKPTDNEEATPSRGPARERRYNQRNLYAPRASKGK